MSQKSNLFGGPGPCARRVVKATLVTMGGQQFVGTNDCETAAKFCPRGDLPTGAGYWMCRDLCEQRGHAEVMALRAAAEQQPNLSLAGSTCFVEGHSYVCSDCAAALHAQGVRQVIFGAPPPVH